MIEKLTVRHLQGILESQTGGMPGTSSKSKMKSEKEKMR
jgi:hypothetical protein